MMSKECWGNLADGGCRKRKRKKKEKKKNQIKTLLLIGGVELLVVAGCYRIFLFALCSNSEVLTDWDLIHNVVSQ